MEIDLSFIVDFFNRILTFISSGIYDFITESFAQFVIYATVSMIKFKIYMIGFAWDTAKQIIIELNLSSYISQVYSYLDSRLISALAFFRVPDAINIITSSVVTRFVLNFMGM